MSPLDSFETCQWTLDHWWEVYGRKTTPPAQASRWPRRLGFFERQSTIIRAAS